MGEETTVHEHHGIDPLLLAALGGNNNGGGMFGGNNGNNSLWPLLFLFGRGMGTWGADGGTACGSLARESLTTPKDVATQLTAFQHWASDNASQLQQAICGIDKSICCSTRDIMSSVNALTPQMYQSFSTLTAGMNSGFAQGQLANCQSTAAIQHALCEGFAAASRQNSQEVHQVQQQIATGFTANALSSQRDTLETRNALDQSIGRLEAQNNKEFGYLATQAERVALQNSIQSQAQNNALNLQLLTNANAAAMAACDMKNAMAACCCDIKGLIREDGQTTRALITDNELNALRAKLADTKDALGNANQSILIGQQIRDAVGTVLHHIPRGPFGAPVAV
jgi:hypothetical protein